MEGSREEEGGNFHSWYRLLQILFKGIVENAELEANTPPRLEVICAAAALSLDQRWPLLVTSFGGDLRSALKLYRLNLCFAKECPQDIRTNLISSLTIAHSPSVGNHDARNKLLRLYDRIPVRPDFKDIEKSDLKELKERYRNDRKKTKVRSSELGILPLHVWVFLHGKPLFKHGRLGRPKPSSEHL